jgi:hypothetical protein
VRWNGRVKNQGGQRNSFQEMLGANTRKEEGEYEIVKLKRTRINILRTLRGPIAPFLLLLKEFLSPIQSIN